MALELLFPHFDALIRTPEDVQRLNEAILQLAVQGKLVPQDPGDEPATELLKRIEATKPRKLAQTNGGPFQLPERWEWTRLGSVLEMEYGKGLPAKERDDGGAVQVFGSNGIVGRHKDALVRQPSVIIGRKGSSGAVNLSLEPCWVIDTAYFVVPPDGLDLQFTYRLLQSLHLENLGKGIKPGLTRNEAYDLILAIPPLAEQHRIVAKVDELFTQTRALEARLRQAQADVVTVNRAALHRLHTAQDDEQFQISWRTLRDHFDLLYDDPRTVAELRQTILDLAVRGKLVAQDANDESAVELLKRIEARRGLAARQISKNATDSLAPIDGDDTIFQLPPGWKWTRFGTIAKLQSGYAFRSHWYSEDGVRLVRNINIKGGAIDWDDAVFLEHERRAEFSEFELRQGDIIISLDRPVISTGLKIALVRLEDLPCLLVQRVGRPVFFEPGLIEVSYVFRWFTSDLFRGAIDPGRSKGIPHISQRDIEGAPIPIPPLAEQQRIVAKVDQLMRLCDELEAGLAQAETARRRATAAALAQA